MRIKDLATRATKLLTGNAYMVFDNGTKVEKVDYAELAKQIITEYNTQTLAGSAQSVKSALDALNSNLYSLQGGNNFVDIPQNSDLNSANYVLPGNYVCGMNSTAASLSNSPVSVAFVMRVESSAGSKVQTGSIWANIIRTIIPHNDPQTIYRQFVSIGDTAGVWTYREWVKMPTRSEVDTLNSKLLEKRLLPGKVLKIAFATYARGALIFGSTSNTNPFVYVYSNGYLTPVVSNNNINAELSSDYKTVTITNNTDTALFLDVISPTGNADIIDT